MRKHELLTLKDDGSLESMRIECMMSVIMDNLNDLFAL